jgi:hypothetical protein
LTAGFGFAAVFAGDVLALAAVAGLGFAAGRAGAAAAGLPAAVALLCALSFDATCCAGLIAFSGESAELSTLSAPPPRPAVIMYAPVAIAPRTATRPKMRTGAESSPTGSLSAAVRRPLNEGTKKGRGLPRPSWHNSPFGGC